MCVAKRWRVNMSKQELQSACKLGCDVVTIVNRSQIASMASEMIASFRELPVIHQRSAIEVLVNQLRRS